MTLYQGGNYAAFECLYQRHSGRVFEYLRAKVSPQGARDLLQEVFLKVHRARMQYSSQYPFLPWLFTISRNAVVDFYRSSEMKNSRLTTSSEHVLDQLAAKSSDSLTTSIHDLASVLGSLPETQKRAIELRYLSDWSFEKIAEEMKTSPENSRQIVSRGIKKIRSLLKGGRG